MNAKKGKKRNETKLNAGAKTNLKSRTLKHASFDVCRARLLSPPTCSACRSEEKAREAMATITSALEAQAAAIRGSTATAIRGKVC